jgi:hypothetical protein
MSQTINWIVEQMDCYPTAEGQTNVVFTVHWRANANENPYSATSYGSVGVAYEAGSSYTPFVDLTQDQVVGWVKAALGDEEVARIEAALAADIANQITPPVVKPPLPWAAA